MIKKGIYNLSINKTIMSLIRDFLFTKKIKSFYRRLFLLFIDVTILPLIISVYFFISNRNLYDKDFSYYLANILLSILISSSIFYFTGQYKPLTKFFGRRSLYFISLRSAIVVGSLIFISSLLGLNNFSILTWIVLLIIMVNFLISYRLIFRDILVIFNKRKNRNIPNVVIYGAGSAGSQLANSLKLSGTHKVNYFIDDNKNIWDRSIDGISVKSPQILKEINQEIDFVLMSLPSVEHKERIKILKDLQKYPSLKVLQIPNLDEITSGISKIDRLRPIVIDDILSRDLISSNEIDPNNFKDKCLCITGAGGSIGSEISIQIFSLKCKRIIIIDNCEKNLYDISNKLNEIRSDKEVEIISLLIDVTNRVFLERVFVNYSVDVVFHAAAYKHVSIVENNPMQGLFNNVISTQIICDIARKLNLEKVILISSDKAVRPTNVMGASKRLSEMILQANAKEILSQKDYNYKKRVIFSMVRFGNVIGSSGSVVPFFEKQIANGGPVTVTHPQVARYFMTIPEAAKLVIKSSTLAEGGDVFLLDMGEPRKIRDLAAQLIRLSGLTLKDDLNPNGDIEIIYTGLKEGEKLYEELLIDSKSLKTSDPYIFKANEKLLEPEKLWPLLETLKQCIKNNDKNKALMTLKEIVPEWQSSFNN